ncbi:MAG: CDP-alcohol phosphatidyltransferase family protein [Thermoplasmatota archaeon]
MVLEDHRKALDLLFDPITRLFASVNPNVISFFSLVFAVGAGVMFALSDRWVDEIGGGRYPWLILIALGMIILNSIADTLDGRIARHTGRTSKVGDFLDHTFDRLSDMAILIGIALSIYCNTIFGLIALSFVLLASYMGTQSQAVGGGRNYRGIMGRADRMVMLMFITAFQFVVEAGWAQKGITEPIFGFEIIPMEVAMGLMLVGGGVTVLMRGYDTYKYLAAEEVREREEEMRRGRPGRGKRARP